MDATFFARLIVLLLQSLLSAGEDLSTAPNSRSPRSDERRLIEHLLGDYGSIQARPVRNSSHAVHVNFSVSINYIVGLDEHNQVLTTYLGKVHQWVDENLVWTPAEYGGVRRIVLSCDAIWTPHIILISNMEEDDKSGPSATCTHSVAVRHDGMCTWSTSAIYKSPCLVNMDNFPFDVQICHLVFGTWMYTLRQLELFPTNGSSWYGISTHNMVNNIEWALLDYNMTKDIVMGANSTINDDEVFHDLVISLVMERNPNYYAKFTLLPVLLLTGLVLLIFWIPPMRPDRTSLGTSLFSSFLLLLILIVDLSPPSAGVKLGAFCCIQMVLISCATLLSIIVVNISHRTDPLPKWAKLVFLDVADSALHCRPSPPLASCKERVCCLNTTVRQTRYRRGVKRSVQVKEAPVTEALSPVRNDVTVQQNPILTPNQQWKRLARVLDTIFFVVYLFVVVGFFIKYFPRPQMDHLDVLTRHHYKD